MSEPTRPRLPLSALSQALTSPPPVRGFGAESPVAGLDRRSIGFLDILAQSLAAIAPTGVAITFPVLMLTQVGGPTLLAALLALVAVLLVASCVNVFARRMVVTGSLYSYVSRASNSAAGLVTSLGLQLGYGCISVFALVSSVKYVGLAMNALLGAALTPAAIAAVYLVLAAVVLAVVARGIRLTLRILLIIETATAAVVLVLVVLLLMSLHAELSWSMLIVPNATPGSLGAGAAIAITAFVGFESSAAVGAEARRPFRDIPRAFVWSVIAAGVLFLLSVLAQAATMRALAVPPGAVPPTAAIADVLGIDLIGPALDLSVGVSFFACAAASATALVRVLFSLGREGALPRRFGLTHPRLKTPAAAVTSTVPVLVVFPVLALLAGVSLDWLIETALVVATLGYLLAYLLVCAAAPLLLWRLQELTLRPVLIAVVASLTLATVIVLYLADEWTHRPVAVLMFFVGLVAGGIFYGLRTARHPGVRRRLGIYDEPVAADVLGAVPSAPVSNAASDQ